VKCGKINASFTPGKTDLIVDEATTLSSHLAPDPTNIVSPSYTWNIPSGFTIVDGSITSSAVTIKFPSAYEQPRSISLTVNAENYCGETTDATEVTVKECYDSWDYTPNITAPPLQEDVDGVIHAKALQEISFTVNPAMPKKSGGTVTYSWTLSDKFQEDSRSQSGENITFKAPRFNSGEEYSLVLRVAAEGYCGYKTAAKHIKVDEPSGGTMQGPVVIKEVVSKNTGGYEVEVRTGIEDNVVWLARGRRVTLVASYDGSDRTDIGDELKYKWALYDGTTDPKWWENEADAGEDGSLTFMPPQNAPTATDYTIYVEAYDNSGNKAPINKSYSLKLGYCEGAHNLPGLYVNSKHRCTVSTAYVKHAKDDGYDDIYPIKYLGEKWWFVENLRSNEDGVTILSDAHREFGGYYPTTARTLLNNVSDNNYCPKGWRIPNTTEWSKLNAYGFGKLAYSEMKPNPVKTDKEWINDISPVPNGEAGFLLLPAGRYNVSTTTLDDYGKLALFISADDTGLMAYGKVNYGAKSDSGYDTWVESGTYRYTVRCVNDYLRVWAYRNEQSNH
jgi:uncharacterized protein (TIGR02145 family)